jgi:hypothetical protein
MRPAITGIPVATPACRVQLSGRSDHVVVISTLFHLHDRAAAMLMQVKLRANVFLRACIAGDAAHEVVFSIGPEAGEHAVRVSDATAHVLLLMMQLSARSA